MKFYQFCVDNNYTGDIAVSKLGIHFKINSSVFSCSQVIPHDMVHLLEDANSNFLDRVLLNLKRMIDNAEI